MSNKEAYIDDLKELESAIDVLLQYVPVGNKKKDALVREAAEKIAGDAKALIGCMKNDYIPVEI